jgi:AGCS family alanine or glycine:cation symporter
MPGKVLGMEETLVSLIKGISSFVWGPFCLIPLLLLTGLYLTLRLRGLQFVRLGNALWAALVLRKEPGAQGDISHFQALMTALAATVGTGNIAGVATAVSLGGPGALLWMWVTGLLGMATKYSEALLSVQFRQLDARGEQCGGPMYYLAKGVHPPAMGRTLGALFAALSAIASFGIGNMVQSNSVAEALAGSFGVTPATTGMVAAVLAGAVIIGGIRWIGRFAGIFVPLMIAAYLVASASFSCAMRASFRPRSASCCRRPFPGRRLSRASPAPPCARRFVMGLRAVSSPMNPGLVRRESRRLPLKLTSRCARLWCP